MASLPGINSTIADLGWQPGRELVNRDNRQTRSAGLQSTSQVEHVAQARPFPAGGGDQVTSKAGQAAASGEVGDAFERLNYFDRGQRAQRAVVQLDRPIDFAVDKDAPGPNVHHSAAHAPLAYALEVFLTRHPRP